MKIATIVGARPQFVKAAVVSRQFRVHPGIQEILIHTGQHYDKELSSIFFTDLQIPQPGYSLEIGSGPQGQQTGRMLIEIEKVLSDIRPDAVLVYGDTNSTLAGALVAVKLRIPVVHVEAGLRSFNRDMPEEVNRVIADHVSHVLFAPTENAVTNLYREGISKDQVHNVGDVMYEAALFYASRAQTSSSILNELQLSSRSDVLATIHRAENTDNAGKLKIICETLASLARSMPVVFPVHPRTRKALESFNLLPTVDNFRIIPPLGYLDMIAIEKDARLVITDSGGVQKEAFFFQVPCVTFRSETEWPELVAMGWNRLAPPVSQEFQMEQIEAGLSYSPTSTGKPYGNGRAAEQIVSVLQDRFIA